MHRRRAARQSVVQLLFQRDYNPELDIAVVLRDFWENNPTDAATRGFAEELLRGTIDNLPQIDGRIRKVAANWDLARMGGVERNVMRLAVYEMLYRADIPPIVSINEAVDIAKAMSEDKAGKFVNGILDRILRDIGRPLRTVADEPKSQG